MSNLADLVHFNEVHHDPKFMRTFRGRKMYQDIFMKLFPYDLKMKWEVCAEPNQHMTYFEYDYTRYLLGIRLFRSYVYGYQVGPGLQQFRIDSVVLGMPVEAYLYHTFIPEAPMNTRFYSHYYTKPTILGFIAGKFMVYTSSQTVKFNNFFEQT